MSQREMRTMMQGAFVLTIASFIAKVLSAIYRVPFQNIAGDEGFYVYQQVYPIYGIAMTLALTGLPQFISKFVAEKEQPLEQKAALEELYPIVFWTGLFLWAGTLIFSLPIAYLMGDEKLAPLVEVVSFTFLLMPPLSMYRGNFQGHLLMEPTAISQVIEQLVRVSIILMSAWGFKALGWSVYQTGTAAMSGAVLGGGFALLTLFYYERKINGGAFSLRKLPVLKKVERGLIRRFLVEGGLVSIYTGLLIFYQLIDSFMVKNALVYYGYSEQSAKIAKGIYDRGQPLVQLGLVIATALSATFLPMLTRYLSKGEGQKFYTSAKVYLRLTTSLALAASVGLALLMPYINYTLFKDYNGNFTLILFVFSVAFTAVIQAYQSIAQSKNSFRPSLKAAGWGLAIKGISTPLLTLLIGTAGASISTLFGLAGTLCYLIRQEEKKLNAFWREKKFGRHLTISLLGMIGMILVYYGVVQLVTGPVIHRTIALFVSVGGVLVGATSFIVLSIRVRLFTIREWLMLPFGNKILRIQFKKKTKDEGE